MRPIRPWIILLAMGLTLALVGCGDDDGSKPQSDADTGVADLADLDDVPSPDVDTSDVAVPDTTDSDATDTTTTQGCDGAPTTSVAPGQCEVIAGSGSTLIVGTVLTPGRVYENGGVVYDSSGTITCVGCGCFAGAESYTQVICNQAVISPGLINAHDHIGWMGDHPRANMPTADVRYEHRHDWRLGDSTEGEGRITTSGGSSNDDKAWGELRFVLSGATSINGSGTAPGLLRNLDKSSGLEGLSEQAVLYETFPLDDNGGELLSSGCAYPGYKNLASAAGAQAYTPHVSEGINAFALNEFRCLNSDANGGHDLLGSNTAIIHGIGLGATEIDAMAGDGVQLIWSPRSNVTLYGETANVTLYHQLGVTIGLGTDWIPSGSMNMLRELACADYLNTHHYGGYFSFEDLWRMVTYDAARTVGMDGSLGLLEVGRVADIAVYFDHAADPYESVVRAGVDDVMLVLRGGDVLAGRSATVGALDSSCEEIDVCGQMQRVCLQREVGKSYAQLEAAGGGDYPAFFCDVPANEPSCVPYRGPGESENGSSEYPDSSITDDQDGDGFADGSDNCPSIFNPIRPMEDGLQADFDQDGVGDVCDPCPLDANTTTCTSFDPDDRDRDGVTDLEDNCLGLPNPAPQADSDSDGKGDLCDACPDDANPGSQGCPSTVYQVQADPNVSNPAAEGDRVRVSCAVTAVYESGFWCQDRLGGPYSGVLVFTDAVPMVGSSPVAEGDDLEVDGLITEFYEQTQLTAPTLALVGQGAVPAPEVVLAADIATTGSLAEAYEGVLVRVESVTVTSMNPDDPNDYDEFAVTGGLRVDDLIYTDLDNTYPVDTAFDSITGPLAYTYNNFKLVPRRDTDLTFGPPRLTGFSSALAYQRVNSAPASTVPGMLYVEMSRPVEAITTIDLVSLDPAIAAVAASVTLQVGEDRAEVLVQGVAADPNAAHLTATLGTDVFDGYVRVLTDDDPASILEVTPTQAGVAFGSTETFAVTLDIPAPLGGATVQLAVVPDVTLAPGTVPTDIVIPFNEMSGSFDFVAGTDAATGTITATLGADPPVSVAVEAIDPTTLSLDIGDYVIVQANSSQTYTIPTGTVIPVEGYVIIGRDTTQAAFEAAWGVSLGANVVYLNGKDVLASNGFPVMNGDETYTLYAPDGTTVVDGTTVPMVGTGKCYQRLVPVAVASDTASWFVGASTDGDPGAGGTPPANPAGLYISEFCDAPAFQNEYIELHNDGF